MKDNNNKKRKINSNNEENICNSNINRYIRKKDKDALLEFSNNTCSNSPNSNVIKNYDCPFWKFNNGYFDESGYEIDHITEFSISGDNSLQNLQLLCAACHSVKSSRFRKNKFIFTTEEIDDGKCIMSVDKK